MRINHISLDRTTGLVHFANMFPERHRRGLAHDMKRFPASAQVKRLLAFPIPEPWVYVVSKKSGITLDQFIASLRQRDVVIVTHGHLIVPPKSRRHDKPRAMFWKTLRAIEERRASVYDLTRKLHTAVPDQRDLFIQEVIERLASAGRGHSGAKNGVKGGRPARDITDEHDAAQRAWFDLRNKLVDDAVAAGPPEWSRDRYYKQFGPRGGRD